MPTENRQFYALVYKADNAFYQAGRSIAINCWHENHGVVGLNTYGEIVNLPGSTITSPPSDTGLVEEGTIFPSTTKFGDSNFKSVTIVKDMFALVTYYVDTASYNANVIVCNPVKPGT